MEHKSQLTFEIEPISDNSVFTRYDTALDKDRPLKVRLDKWLWASRFFKTRALARAAIEQGKIIYDGDKTIPTKEIAIGGKVQMALGNTKKCIIIRKLSTRRRNASEANELYDETAVLNQ